jgi:hypothetical protein
LRISARRRYFAAIIALECAIAPPPLGARQEQSQRMSRPEVKIAMLSAGIIAAGTVALLALGLSPSTAPVATPAPVAERAVAVISAPADDGLRSVRYYPEQLAALQSLNDFHPIADQGEKHAPAVVAAPAKPAPFEPKPIRRADTAPKSVVAIVAPTAPAPAAPPRTPEDKTVKTFKILGVPVPGAAQIGDRAVAVRDEAGRWGSAVAGFGQKLVTFWR